jgi:hypothetical protein
MKNSQQATHSHKRLGSVVVLQSTVELAKISVSASGDECWVKLIDLTPLLAGVIEESKPGKKHSEKPARIPHRTVVAA